MPDFLIDYETLHKLGVKAGELKQKVDDAQAKEASTRYTEAQIGTKQTAYAVEDFWDEWRYACSKARDVLGNLQTTFTSVGQSLFDQDASLASGAMTQGAQYDYADYQSKVQAYKTWEKLSNTYVTLHHRDENGNIVETRVPLADASNRPDQPGEPPKDWNYTNPDGSSNSTNFTYGPDGEVTSVTTNVVNKDGLSHKEHTTFSPNGGYRSEISHADGTSSSIELTVSPDGTTGTRTVIDGEGKKTTYQGAMSQDQKTWSKTDG